MIVETAGALPFLVTAWLEPLPNTDEPLVTGDDDMTPFPFVVAVVAIVERPFIGSIPSVLVLLLLLPLAMELGPAARRFRF